PKPWGEPPTPLTVRDFGFSGLISARIYTRIEASECGRAEPHAEPVGHVWVCTINPTPTDGKGAMLPVVRVVRSLRKLAARAGWRSIWRGRQLSTDPIRCSHTAIGQVTAQMVDVIMACRNLKPSQVLLAHRTCAEAAAVAHAVCHRLRGQEPASQLQPMPRLNSTPTQALAEPGPAHAPCPHHLPNQPPSHPSQLQESSQHHPALPALLHLPGLSILTRPATNPVTSPAVEQQPIIHTTEEQDEQTMPPSMPKQQQDWATARAIVAAVLQQIQQVPALLRLLRSQPGSKVTLQLSTLQDAEAQLGRLEFALQHIMQPR
ncbi:hypothetical protein HaLaN_11807, partial [Haematococcus lacustris]